MFGDRQRGTYATRMVFTKPFIRRASNAAWRFELVVTITRPCSGTERKYTHHRTIIQEHHRYEGAASKDQPSIDDRASVKPRSTQEHNTPLFCSLHPECFGCVHTQSHLPQLLIAESTVESERIAKRRDLHLGCVRKASHTQCAHSSCCAMSLSKQRSENVENAIACIRSKTFGFLAISACRRPSCSN